MYSRTHSQMITCIKIYFVLQDTCQLHAASISCKENFVQNVDAILLIPCQIIHNGNRTEPSPIQSVIILNSMSGKDEPNRALLLQAGAILPTQDYSN